MSDEFWQNYTFGLAPLAGKKPKKRLTKPVADKSAVRKAATIMPVIAPKAVGISGLAGNVKNALERKREKAIRDGSIEINAKLDLHGMTQVEAFEALTKFMHAKAKADKRHLLIITGKGKDGAGVLRNNLQHWLGQLPEAKSVLALRPAATCHGGSGAFYVILRKK